MEKNLQMILEELSRVIDPEIGVSIIDMDLVDNVKIEGEVARITFHPSMPHYPSSFAVAMAAEIKERVSNVPGIQKVLINVSDHVLAEEINRQVNEAA